MLEGIDCIEYRGTAEKQDQTNTFLKQFIWAHLRKDRFPRWIDGIYPASIGAMNPDGTLDGPPLKDSVAAGVRHAPQQIRLCRPRRVALFGFSQGCMVIVRLLEEIARGKHPELQVAFAVLVANPLRNPGDSWDADDAPYFGLAGKHIPYPAGIPVFEIANPQDGITCTPGNSPLRTLSDIVDPFTFARGGGWTIGLAERMMRGQFQLVGVPWWQLLDVAQRYGQAGALMRGYVKDDQHVGNYVKWGYMDRIVHALNNDYLAHIL